MYDTSSKFVVLHSILMMLRPRMTSHFKLGHPRWPSLNRRTLSVHFKFTKSLFVTMTQNHNHYNDIILLLHNQKTHIYIAIAIKCTVH